ncbi:MAG TPA: TonB family protein [Vicinamibacterales bacterium]
MNQRRSSFTVISISAHALVLSAVLVFPLFAPVPTPRLIAPGLAWAPERVVQPVDINLPAPARNRTESRASASPQPADTPPIRDAAPLEPQTGIAPETGREAILDGTRERVSALEHGGTSVDGLGVTENPPPAPPAPAPQPPQRLHQGIQAPRKVVDVAPRYPALARESHVEGIVILDVIIDETGKVTSTRVLRSVALLDQAAIDAVRLWKFTPARLNGEPIPIVMTVTVAFRLQ